MVFFKTNESCVDRGLSKAHRPWGSKHNHPLQTRRAVSDTRGSIEAISRSQQEASLEVERLREQYNRDFETFNRSVDSVEGAVRAAGATHGSNATQVG